MSKFIFCLLSIIISSAACLGGEIDTLLAIQNDNVLVSIPQLPDGTTWQSQTDIKPLRLGIVAGGIVAAEVGGLLYWNYTWYDTKTGSFHFNDFSEDMKVYQKMDKLGHMIHAYVITDLFAKAYRWSGFSVRSSIWLASATAFFWMLQIEIKDGFYPDWGFSLGDFGANTLGISLAALRQFYPEQLGGFRFKASYHVSTAYRYKLYTNKNVGHPEDYEGLTFWAAANVHDFMPKNIQRTYPGWLKPFGIAIGYSVKKVANDVFGGYNEVYLSLDLDLTKISMGGFDQFGIVIFLKDILNYIKLPMPTVRLSPKTTYVGFYF